MKTITTRFLSFLLLLSCYISSSADLKANNILAGLHGAPPTTAVIQTVNAIVESQSIKISWNVSSLEAIVEFQVQRASLRNGSGKDVQWETISVISINTAKRHLGKYEYHDMTSGNGAQVVLYRILARQNDDGILYSSTVQIKLIGTSSFQLKSLYPNPVAAGAASTVQYSVTSPETVSISLYDLSGKLVKTLTHSFHQIGAYNLPISTSTLSAGRYFVRMTSSSASRSASLLVKQ